MPRVRANSPLALATGFGPVTRVLHDVLGIGQRNGIERQRPAAKGRAKLTFAALEMTAPDAFRDSRQQGPSP